MGYCRVLGNNLLFSIGWHKECWKFGSVRRSGSFIDSTAEDFGQYITTEILAQGLKIELTAEAGKANCIMKATAVLGGFRNTGSGSIQMIGPNSRVIWSATSGDKDSVKDLAHNLVKQLKHDLPK